MKDKQYIWKKGRRKIVAIITPLDKHELFQSEMKMFMQMSLAGYKLDSRKSVK